MLGNVMDQESIAYFRSRKSAEIAAVSRATSDQARRAHLQLATAYARLIGEPTVVEHQSEH